VVVPVRILVLEDNLYLAPPLVRLLKRSGYDVTHADTCAKARAIDTRFDLGVFDLDLPDGTGIEVSSELLRDGLLGAVVFYTGTLNDALLLRAQKFAACVRKTDGMNALLEAIRNTLAIESRRAAGSIADRRFHSSPTGRGDH
jgi:DNA-binding response OmpR family regulator